MSAPEALSGSALSDGERINRICHLLSKAVVRDWAARVVTEQPRLQVSAEHTEQSEASDGVRILAYLALVGEASPAAIRETVGLARMRVYRAMQPLLAAGRIVSKGQGRTTTYCLSSGEARKIILN